MRGMRGVFVLFVLFFSVGCAQNDKKLNANIDNQKIDLEVKKDGHYNQLTESEKNVLIHKGTERAFTGMYWDNHAQGEYLCRQCNLALFKSDAKFESGSGWPAFDDFIPGSISFNQDTDGTRTEVVCSNCHGHLGHVFRGEHFTPKDIRYCVNSNSLNFVSEKQLENAIKDEKTMSNTILDTAIFASGCFWGTEYFFERAEGVKSTEVGYIGGTIENPTYAQVSTGKTGHAEATRVIYDPTITDYETLCKLFFETHDPSQTDRQGPDVGTQYRTEVFYLNDQQKETAEKLKKQLENKGISVATKISPASAFYKAENYHQQYYTGNGSTPYCHGYTKRF